MKGKANSKSNVIEPGGVDEYIKQCPNGIQSRLRDIRSAIRKAAPGSTETVSYFQMPGYCYEGYDYNGMFAWFSFKTPYVRLHVRPPVLAENIKHLGDYTTTKAIISFPAKKVIPKALVQKLVKASIRVMKQKQKNSRS
jgi:uncharacterized protein YdhG (YjbR/CyaY superfamily)